MFRIKIVLLGIFSAAIMACAALASSDGPAVVPFVDLARYMGTWYEIAAMPNRMQKGCADTVVYYRLNNVGTPYWIVDLDPNYRYAAVGVPNRSQLWIISRESTLDPAIYDGILQRMKAQGFDVSKLVKTIHTGKKPQNPYSEPANKN